MRIALFYPSLVSDWNNGNAHFLRGVATELQGRGHRVRVFEPADGWSRANLLKCEGAGALEDFQRTYPTLSSTLYRLGPAEGMASTSNPPANRVGGQDGPSVDVRVEHGGRQGCALRVWARMVCRSACLQARRVRSPASSRPVRPSRAWSLAAPSEPGVPRSNLVQATLVGDASTNARSIQAQPELEAGGDGEPLHLEAVLDEADLVLVHEWNDPTLVRAIGTARKNGGRFTLLFHDTHHRAVTDPEAMARFDLSGYDGVLAFGRVLRDLYVARGWAARAWTWHEAADTRLFRPPQVEKERSGLVWIGNWGDEERTSELAEFLLGPVHALGLRATAYGVRYPEAGQAALAAAGIDYAGWLANFMVPSVFARHAVTVHVPRRPYALALPGIPTIRVFEALACGIPLVSAPWDDAEHLFSSGADYLVARDGKEMATHLRMLLADRDYAAALAAHGLATVQARHSCAHRVHELLAIYHELRGADREAEAGA